MAIRKLGEYLISDHFNNVGGLNVSDSPFAVADESATDGNNFEYTQLGGISRVYGSTKTASSADSNLITAGLLTYAPTTSARSFLRVSGKDSTHINVQLLDANQAPSTKLSDDSVSALQNIVVGVDNTSESSVVPAVSSMFSTPAVDALWFGGCGLTNIYGAYSTTKVTPNGVAPFAGSIAVADGGGSGSTLVNQAYYYAVVAFKASTGARSNATLDATVTPTAGHNVTVDLTGITAYDTTRYTQIWIYRSSPSGSTSFTAGSLVAKIAYNGTTYTIASGGGSISGGVYTDTGSSITSSVTVPRENFPTLDNSTLAKLASTYAGIPGTPAITSIATFKRHLFTAMNGTVMWSDLDKPESWPVGNFITIPSGGAVTALVAVGYTNVLTNLPNEILCAFKDNELWIITGAGTTADPFALTFVDYVGCPGQSLIVSAHGFVSWINYRGVWMWDGTQKPIFASKNLNYLFDNLTGTVDKSRLSKGFGLYNQAKQQANWIVSNVNGINSGRNNRRIRLDYRLTMPTIAQNLDGRVLNATLMVDDLQYALYAGASVRVSSASNEVVLFGDNAGFTYTGFNSFTDSGYQVPFSYKTKYLDFGEPGKTKRFKQVTLWVKAQAAQSIYLQYWTTYSTDSAQSSSPAPISVASAPSAIFYDTNAYYDAGAYYSDGVSQYVPVTFNLSQSSEGVCLALKFYQTQSPSSIDIAGFQVLFSDLGSRN